MVARGVHALMGAAVPGVWLSRAFAAIGSAPQSPAASSGWHIPDSATADRRIFPARSRA